MSLCAVWLLCPRRRVRWTSEDAVSEFPQAVERIEGRQGNTGRAANPPSETLVP